jgi:hypothetical protein
MGTRCGGGIDELRARAILLIRDNEVRAAGIEGDSLEGDASDFAAGETWSNLGRGGDC